MSSTSNRLSLNKPKSNNGNILKPPVEVSKFYDQTYSSAYRPKALLNSIIQQGYSMPEFSTFNTGEMPSQIITDVLAVKIFVLNSLNTSSLLKWKTKRTGFLEKQTAITAEYPVVKGKKSVLLAVEQVQCRSKSAQLSRVLLSRCNADQNLLSCP